MIYTIFELCAPESLQRIDRSGYHPTTVDRHVLEMLDVYGVKTNHPSLESATAEIRTNCDKLTHRTLTILPIMHIHWNGEEATL